jgi:glycine cleavage system transcriptional repressor
LTEEYNKSSKLNYLVISALGRDRPGIVNELSSLIHEQDCNIVDSRMTVLGGEFAIILMVSGSWNQVAKVEQALPAMEKKLGLTLIAKQTETRPARANLLPYTVEVISIDHPGIVHSIADFFSRRQINIEEMNTGSYAAAHTGSPMFTVNITVSIPSDISISELREQFLDFCDELNLDAVIEPIKS